MATVRNDRDKMLLATTPRVIVNNQLVLSNSYLVVPANYFGEVETPSLANVAFNIEADGTINNTGWSFALTNTGCTASISSNVILFDDFTSGNTTDSCTISITATHGYYSSITKTVTIVRIKSSVIPASILLTPSFGILQKDSTGEVTNFASASTNIKVISSSNTDVTDDWVLSKVDTGINTNISGLTTKTLDVTGFTIDPGDISTSNIVIFDQLNGASNDIGPYEVTSSATAGGPIVTFSSSGGPYSGYGCIVYDSSAPGYDPTYTQLKNPSLHNRAMTVGENWSLSCWVKFGSVPSSYYTIFGTGMSGFNLKALDLQRATSTTVYFSGRFFGWVYNSGAPGNSFSLSFSFSSSPFTLIVDEWMFLELTFDVATKKLRLFKDGILVGENSSSPTNEDNAAIGGDAYYDPFNAGINYSQTAYLGGRMHGKLAEFVYQVGGTVPTSSYTSPSSPRVPSTNPSNTYTTISATNTSGFTINKKYEVFVAGASSDVILLIPEKASGYLTVDWNGDNVDYSNAHNKFTIKVNGEDQTSSWRWFAINAGGTSGITASLSNSGVLTISGFSGTSERAINISAGRPGYPTQIFQYKLAVVKRAQPAVALSGTFSVTVNADTNGVVPSSSLPINVNVVATETSSTVTSAYTWTVTASTGLTLSSSSGSSVNITAVTNSFNNGIVTFTGTRSGMPTVNFYVAVNKAKILLPEGVAVNIPYVYSYVPNNTTGSIVTSKARFNPDGTIEKYTSLTGVWTLVGNWYNPTTSSIGSNYSIILIGGTFDGTSNGPTSWTSLSSAVEWTVSSNSSGSATRILQGQVNIRLNSSPETIVATGSLAILAESNP